MSTEVRLVIAIALMLAVLVGGNLLFPPAQPEPGVGPVTAVEEEAPQPSTPVPDAPPADVVEVPGDPDAQAPPAADPVLPELTPVEELPTPAAPVDVVEGEVFVEGPLYRYRFSNIGARAQSVELPAFRSFTREGPVELVEAGTPGFLGSRIVVDADTVDLRGVPFQVSPEGGLVLEAGGEPQTLSFRYDHPSEPFAFEVNYLFDPDSYVVEVSGRTYGLPRGLLVSDLGTGLAFNEVDDRAEARHMAWVGNHLQQGIQSTELSDVPERLAEDGPFLWVAVRSQYFAAFVLPGGVAGGSEYLGGVFGGALPDLEDRAEVTVTQSLGSGGTFGFRFFAGPQEYATLAALGNDAQEVNPIGWRFFRPVLRPFIGIITWVLIALHDSLAIGYGWVLMLVGVLMRILLFPLNHKAMKAQLRNMAVQPLLKEIQTKYKDQPEKMQKELMKLYKEHGFNPLAGCWPMLLPWPVLIALFFVFQNTIELRGVPFAWLPDLAARDPVFVLPVLLGISMFLLQWVSFRTLDEVNPQMKMMMWFLPIFMVVLFANLPSGLNLYYLTANLATLPQSWWIARERQKVQAAAKGAKGPPEPAEA
jgi:YidC/Oxa1 family membrane protein insertase